MKFKLYKIINIYFDGARDKFEKLESKRGKGRIITEAWQS